MRYNLPPTDPRYLDADPDEILEDSLMWLYIEAERRAARDPVGRIGEQMESNGEAFDEVDRAALDELSDLNVAERLRALAPAMEQVVTAVRLARGRVVTDGG